MSRCFLVEFTLLTGRTHQIRAHAHYAGFPLLGDRLYHSVSSMQVSERVGAAPHQHLHAQTLSFTHPRTGETMKVSSQPLIPVWFETAMKKIEAAK